MGLRRIFCHEAQQWGLFSAVGFYILIPFLWLVFVLARLFWE